jgi:ABC-type multidrug transport system fused ATPase/permease subunit
MLRDLVRALRLIPRRRRWQWVVLIPLTLTAAALESMGAGVVLTLGTIVAEPARAGSLPVVSRIAAWLPPAAPKDLIITVTAGVVVFYIARGLLLTMFAWVQETVVQRTASEVARRLLGAYLAAPYVFHLRRNSARLIQAAGHSIEAVFSSGLGAAVNFATEALTLAGLIAVLAFAAPLATLVAVVTIGVVLLGPFLVTRHLAVRYGADGKILQEALLKDLQQSLASFKEVRVMGAELHFLSAFSAHRDQLASVRKRQGALTTAVRVFVESTFVVAILIAVILVAARGASGGSLIGLMALYAYAGFRVVPAANRLILNFAAFQGARPHVEGLWNDFSLLERPTAGEQNAARTETLPFADRIDLQSVSYTYEEGRGQALNDVTLTIRRGESVGIVGATGAGKSTLVDILLGLLDPRLGKVLIDGRDIRANVGLWQQRIGYVAQGFALLDDTLRRNVAFGRADTEIDDADVEAALRLAHLSEAVASHPRGLDTRLGERGIRLSGGERQRVAIARALYRNPDVLVFDEATSALDQQTEQAIIRAIDELRGVKTLVVVAHRLSTVRGCDRLVFLEDGRITGEGSYNDLLERHLGFRGMVSAGVT